MKQNKILKKLLGKTTICHDFKSENKKNIIFASIKTNILIEIVLSPVNSRDAISWP